jgi:two-component system, NtrC family, response regulator PilR
VWGKVIVSMARILLVDDEESVLRTVGMLFRSEGHEVVPVRESEKAAEIIRSPEKFDLLLTDIRMSPIDGMEIIRLARETRPGMQIVVISAYCSEKTVKQAMQLGCTSYVKKPFKTDEVLGAVRGALEKTGTPAPQ